MIRGEAAAWLGDDQATLALLELGAQIQWGVGPKRVGEILEEAEAGS